MLRVETEEGGDAGGGGGEVGDDVLEAEPEGVPFEALRPPGHEVFPVAAAAGAVEDEVEGEVADRHGSGLEHPAAKEVEEGDERIDRVADDEDVAPVLRCQIPAQVGLERPGIGPLGCVEVEADVVGDFDPGDDFRDLVEVHVAAGAESVDDLLHERRAGLGVGGDQDVAGLQAEVETAPYPLRGGETGHAPLDAVDRGCPARRRGVVGHPSTSADRSTPTGQWSEPVTWVRMNARSTKRIAASEASTRSIRQPTLRSRALKACFHQL